MIKEGKFRLTGLKEDDITYEIHNLIDKASDFIVICGYGFTNHRNPNSILKKVLDSKLVCKHCILPITLFRGQDANRNKSIDLIRAGVSISIENKNHSKWIMSEKEIYYGSANFTMDSLQRKIEVATFKDFRKSDILKKEFLDFVIRSMSSMKSNSDRRKLWGVLKKNDLLTQEAKSLIKKLNPSVEKVVETIDNISIVRTHIAQILENNYWFLNDNYYRELTKFAHRTNTIIQNINYRGNRILDSNGNIQIVDELIFDYNYACNKFYGYAEELNEISKELLKQTNRVPVFATKNRKLLKNNNEIISKNLQL